MSTSIDNVPSMMNQDHDEVIDMDQQSPGGGGGGGHHSDHDDDERTPDEESPATISHSHSNGGHNDGGDASGDEATSANDAAEHEGDDGDGGDDDSDSDDSDEDEDRATTKRAMQSRLSPVRDRKKRRMNETNGIMTMNGHRAGLGQHRQLLSFDERLNIVRIAAELSTMPRESSQRASVIERLRPSLTDDNLVAMILAVAQSSPDAAISLKKLIAESLTPLFPITEKPLSHHFTDQLFGNIFKYLDAQTIARTICRVCRAWTRILCLPTTWRCATVEIEHERQIDAWLAAPPRCHMDTQVLDIQVGQRKRNWRDHHYDSDDEEDENREYDTRRIDMLVGGTFKRLHALRIDWPQANPGLWLPLVDHSLQHMNGTHSSNDGHITASPTLTASSSSISLASLASLSSLSSSSSAPYHTPSSATYSTFAPSTWAQLTRVHLIHAYINEDVHESASWPTSLTSLRLDETRFDTARPMPFRIPKHLHRFYLRGPQSSSTLDLAPSAHSLRQLVIDMWANEGGLAGVLTKDGVALPRLPPRCMIAIEQLTLRGGQTINCGHFITMVLCAVSEKAPLKHLHIGCPSALAARTIGELPFNMAASTVPMAPPPPKPRNIPVSIGDSDATGIPAVVLPDQFPHMETLFMGPMANEDLFRQVGAHFSQCMPRLTILGTRDDRPRDTSAMMTSVAHWRYRPRGVMVFGALTAEMMVQGRNDAQLARAGVISDDQKEDEYCVRDTYAIRISDPRLTSANDVYQRAGGSLQPGDTLVIPPRNFQPVVSPPLVAATVMQGPVQTSIVAALTTSVTSPSNASVATTASTSSNGSVGSTKPGCVAPFIHCAVSSASLVMADRWSHHASPLISLPLPPATAGPQSWHKLYGTSMSTARAVSHSWLCLHPAYRIFQQANPGIWLQLVQLDQLNWPSLWAGRPRAAMQTNDDIDDHRDGSWVSWRHPHMVDLTQLWSINSPSSSPSPRSTPSITPNHNHTTSSTSGGGCPFASLPSCTPFGGGHMGGGIRCLCEDDTDRIPPPLPLAGAVRSELLPWTKPTPKPVPIVPNDAPPPGFCGW